MSLDVRCPYCSGGRGRCTASASGRPVTECASCGRVIQEHHLPSSSTSSSLHHLFFLRSHDSPLPLVTTDLPIPLPVSAPLPEDADEDPFENIGFITAFPTWSLERFPVSTASCSSFSGHLAEMERALQLDSADNAPSATGLVDLLRAYLQIVDVSSILGVERDIAEHAVELFKDCSSTTHLRNRNIEALATAALVQAVREAQEPRTLQEISAAANIPQKEIGKYMKVLGDVLKLSQPINSNSISVHMPRFCTRLQLNKATQDLATHIGEIVMNKCFCTRRNPISISAAAIYLSCQLEDRRKTQAEICKVTGLTEVTLRKVCKELLENLEDLLPANYSPAVPLEKAFLTTACTSSRSAAFFFFFGRNRSGSSSKPDVAEASSPPCAQLDNVKLTSSGKQTKVTVSDGADVDEDLQLEKRKDCNWRNTSSLLSFAASGESKGDVDMKEASDWRIEHEHRGSHGTSSAVGNQGESRERMWSFQGSLPSSSYLDFLPKVASSRSHEDWLDVKMEDGHGSGSKSFRE